MFYQSQTNCGFMLLLCRMILVTLKWEWVRCEVTGTVRLNFDENYRKKLHTVCLYVFLTVFFTLKLHFRTVCNTVPYVPYVIRAVSVPYVIRYGNAVLFFLYQTVFFPQA